MAATKVSKMLAVRVLWKVEMTVVMRVLLTVWKMDLRKVEMTASKMVPMRV